MPIKPHKSTIQFVPCLSLKGSRHIYEASCSDCVASSKIQREKEQSISYSSLQQIYSKRLFMALGLAFVQLKGQLRKNNLLDFMFG